MRKFLLMIAVALSTTVAYAQIEAAWSSSISAVGATDAVDFSSPAAMDKDGNLYVTGTQTENFEFAGNDAEVLALGAYIAKYNAKGEELYAITLHGSISITAITTDADNNFYVAGSFADMAYITGVDGVNGEYEVIESSEPDSRLAAFIAKYDADGNLLAVKSYEAEHNDFMKEMDANWMYWGMAPSVSISKIIAEGSNVYAQFSYIGGVAVDENLTTEAKYIDYYGMGYLEFAATSLVSFDSNIENASEVAQLTISDNGDASTSVLSFNFAVEGSDVYVAALGMGNLVLTTSAGSEAIDFEYDGMGTTEKGAILAKIGSKVVKVSNIANEAHYGFDEISAFEVREGNLYLAGTFAGSCAFDNSKVAVGASDVFVASVDADELFVNWVYTNANDEGATNKYYEVVTGVAFGKEHVYVVDAITDMNNNEAPVAKSYAVSFAGEGAEIDAIAATTVAYNNEYVAFINYTDATYIKVSKIAAVEEEVKELWNSSISAVGAMDAVDFSSPAAMDKDGNLYVTGTQTENFEFAGNDAEVLALGAYIAKYNAKGEELYAITLHGSISITAITTDADNNFYVAGSFADMAYITGVDGVNGEYEVIESSEPDSRLAAFIAKYDADGNLLEVKSYEAEHNATIAEMNDFGLYWGGAAKVSISKLVAEGSKVYAQFHYTGDVAVDGLTLTAKYMFVWDMAYMDVASIAVVSFDTKLAGATNEASVSVADVCADASGVDSFNFTVDGDDIYVAAFATGNVVLATSAGEEAFDFATTDDYSGNVEAGVILANAGKSSVKISNELYVGYGYYNVVSGMDIKDGNLYIAGTFEGPCAFDNNKEAVGASDVFVASVDAEELSVNWVYTNANDEGATNKYYEVVTGVAFGKEHVYIVDAITDMNNAEAPVVKNYAIAYTGEAKEADAIAATTLAYNDEYVAFINYTDATYISVYNEAVTTEIESVNAEVENNVIYDLTGRRIEKITESGIYIVNGNKVLVK